MLIVPRFLVISELSIPNPRKGNERMLFAPHVPKTFCEISATFESIPIIISE